MKRNGISPGWGINERTSGLLTIHHSGPQNTQAFHMGLRDFFILQASNELQRSITLWQLKKVLLARVVSGVWKLDLAR
jgi:hypothetical protein